MDEFKERLRRCRLRILDMCFKAKAGHIGSSLSCVDLLIAVYTMRGKSDPVVLSKGHAVAALYAVLVEFGFMREEELDRFYQNAGLPAHVPHDIATVPFATGSLGHGLSLAAGLALRQKQGRVFCIVSDGELQEGSSLEALRFIYEHCLPVVILIDHNERQGLGELLEGTLEMATEYAERGDWLTVVGGYAPDVGAGEELIKLSASIMSGSDGPSTIVCQQSKGAGVSFLRDKFESHYQVLTKGEYEVARVEVAGAR